MIFVFKHVTVEAEYDGDTFHAYIDQGCSTYRRQRVRMHGVSAVELDKPGGTEARDLIAALIPVGEAVELTSHKWTYDRIDCDVVRVRDGLDVNKAATQTLRDHGLEGGR